MEPFEKWQVATCCFSKSFVQIGEICQPIWRKGDIKKSEENSTYSYLYRAQGRCTASFIQPIKYSVVFYIYAGVCVRSVCHMWLKTAPNHSKLVSGTVKTGVIMLMGEAMRAHRNIDLVRVGLVISVDWEQETGLDHIVKAPATLPRLKQVIMVLINTDLKKRVLYFAYSVPLCVCRW